MTTRSCLEPCDGYPVPIMLTIGADNAHVDCCAYLHRWHKSKPRGCRFGHRILCLLLHTSGSAEPRLYRTMKTFLKGDGPVWRPIVGITPEKVLRDSSFHTEVFWIARGEVSPVVLLSALVKGEHITIQ